VSRDARQRRLPILTKMGAEKAKPGVNWSESDNKAARPVKTWRSDETGKV